MKAILDIEEKAQGIMKTMDDLKLQKTQETEEKLKNLEEQITKEAEKRINQHRERVAEKTKTELSELETFCDNQKTKLKTRYEEKADEWVSEITARIMKDEG